MPNQYAHHKFTEKRIEETGKDVKNRGMFFSSVNIHHHMLDSVNNDLWWC